MFGVGGAARLLVMAVPESNPSSRERPADRPAGRLSRATASASRRGTWRDLDQASIMTVELLSGLLVWGGLGWWVGTQWGGHPWPFIIGSVLGFAGGFYLLYLRAAGRIGGPRRAEAPSANDDGGVQEPVEGAGQGPEGPDAGRDGADGDPGRS